MRLFLACALLPLFGFPLAAPGAAQDLPAGYDLPPQSIVDIVTADPIPSTSLSPDGQWILQIERDALPDISELARRMLPLAGMRIDPVANAPFRSRFSRSVSLRPTLLKPDGPSLVRIPLPPQSQVAEVSWSHRSNCFFVVTVSAEGSSLWWVAANAPEQPRRLTQRLCSVLNGPRWLPDGRRVLASIWPDGRGPEPAAPDVPLGPNVQESSGQLSPTRTYQDLLRSPHDEALFRYYGTTQLMAFDPEAEARPIGAPGMIFDASVAPNGAYVLVHRLEGPMSYVHPWRGFPYRVELWDGNGKVLREIARIPMADNIPIGGVAKGPRSVDWIASRPATLVWREALDGGDPKAEVPHRDRLLAWAGPFEEAPVEWLRVEHRVWSLQSFSHAAWLGVREYDRDRRWVRTLLHNLEDSGSAPIALENRSLRDRYGDPGRFLTVPDESGRWVVQQEGPFGYRTGSGSSPEGDLPFFDRVDLRTGQSERLWRCSPESYETVLAAWMQAEGQAPSLITRHESQDEPPNLRLRRLASNSFDPITQFADPTPQVRSIPKRLVHYERADGVPLSATLYTPEGWQEGQPLPLLIWAYPIEFNDAKTAGQVSGSAHRFTRMAGSSHLLLATQGYAILDNATMPVIGDPETMNDTFLDQIVASAQAAIDFAVESGVADRERVAVGGHSYGAFMTANLLAHCDLFQAGIARSGAYNRTLTPFGFQSERRPLWEAKSVYFTISPFLAADQINEPLLLIHGELDNNSGTYPMQSRRLYQAIKGLGGTVRLCMLPLEGHGYRAKQSVLHTQAEMLRWLNQHLAASPSAPEKAQESSTKSAPLIEAGAPK